MREIRGISNVPGILLPGENSPTDDAQPPFLKPESVSEPLGQKRGECPRLFSPLSFLNQQFKIKFQNWWLHGRRNFGPLHRRAGRTFLESPRVTGSILATVASRVVNRGHLFSLVLTCCFVHRWRASKPFWAGPR